VYTKIRSLWLRPTNAAKAAFVRGAAREKAPRRAREHKKISVYHKALFDFLAATAARHEGRRNTKAPYNLSVSGCGMQMPLKIASFARGAA
jgi:hypothetical protein